MYLLHISQTECLDSWESFIKLKSLYNVNAITYYHMRCIHSLNIKCTFSWIFYLFFLDANGLPSLENRSMCWHRFFCTSKDLKLFTLLTSGSIWSCDWKIVIKILIFWKKKLESVFLFGIWTSSQHQLQRIVTCNCDKKNAIKCRQLFIKFSINVRNFWFRFLCGCSDERMSKWIVPFFPQRVNTAKVKWETR